MFSNVNHKEAFSHYSREASIDGSNRESSILVSPSIRNHYRNDHARELFEKREGQPIQKPEKADQWPLQSYLEVHRNKLAS